MVGTLTRDNCCPTGKSSQMGRVSPLFINYIMASIRGALDLDVGDAVFDNLFYEANISVIFLVRTEVQ